jgi:hypothetical protein
METSMGEPLSNYPDPSLTLGEEINCMDRASCTFNYPDPSLVLERVSGCLEDALRLFAEGDSEQACRYLSAANLAFESSQAAVKSAATVTHISSGDRAFSRPVERAEPLLARAATA